MHINNKNTPQPEPKPEPEHAQFILHLLANKADENFSCYPSIRTLMAESGAGRSTVMRALKELEASGLITRQAQFHDSGARRSSRYYLNHSLAPHCLPRPDPEPPRPDSKPPLFQGETGGVSGRHHPGVSDRDQLNPPDEPPTQPDAMRVLRAMPEPWRVGGSDAQRLVPAVEAALMSGWTANNLAAHLARDPRGAEAQRGSWLGVSLICLTQLQDLAPPWSGAASAKTSGHAPSQ